MRLIDADALKNQIRHMPRTINPDLVQYKLVQAIIANAPTLTPQNEPLTWETVAEILAEQFGDECACNINGNDEWLPMMCHYGDVCPDPPEHLGCWMELLRNKYRRPPERQEDT